MVFRLFTTYVFCLGLHGSTGAEDSSCGLRREWLESVSVSMDISKNGFHRELVTIVEFAPGFPDGLQALLLHRLPNGIYLDPYQLASLKEDTGLQVLLESAVDLEAPAHTSEGLTALVYPSLDAGLRLIKATLPIHARYQKPSPTGKRFEGVNIALPKLLLRTDSCTQLPSLPPPNIVDAPCTVHNASLCQWLEVQHVPEQGRLSFEMPLGDRSLVMPVCAGTLLVTLLCCVILSRTIWRHGLL